MIGIKNVGNTCYLNSGVQSLLALDSMKQLILDDEVVKRLESNFKKEPKERTRLVYSFWLLSRDILKGVKPNPNRFISSLWSLYPHLSDYTQQDSVEFVQLLLDSIHEELKIQIEPEASTPDDDQTKIQKIEADEIPPVLDEPNKKVDGKPQVSGDPNNLYKQLIPKHDASTKIPKQKYTSPIQEKFGGFLQSELKCNQCGTPSNCVDPFFDISLSMPDENPQEHDENIFKKVYKLLKSVVSSLPLLNLLLCGQTYSLLQLLVLFFSRQPLDEDMNCEACKCKRSGSKKLRVLKVPDKRTNHVTFPSEINVDGTTYKLKSVVNHHGSSLAGGHYTSFVIDKLFGWWLCDDKYTKKVALEDVESSEVYLLFYEKVHE
ncbi:ubiquitin carboxyl-terminal hydrolase [Acrasis kona]|uniref:Ubiquitin carboxyl-terminal hydrolase n=1 Tax=Acrasis kona TaxID=1008807 RepID=A0AAW2YQK2_9EUKA